MTRRTFKSSTVCIGGSSSLADRHPDARSMPCPEAQQRRQHCVSSTTARDFNTGCRIESLPFLQRPTTHEGRSCSQMGESVLEEDSELVTDALELARREPARPALWVLDQVMHAHTGQCLDFAFDDEELGEPHPFAELIRQAFAPHLDPAELTLMEIETDSDAKLTYRARRYQRLRGEWNEALLRFAVRYDLWSPLAD
jgi:hypothetical protein